MWKYLFLFVLITSCHTSKHVHTDTTVNTHEKVLTDSVDLMKKEISRLESKLKEFDYLNITFDPTKCPSIPPIPEGMAMMDKDTINKLIQEYNNLIGGLNNKIEIGTNGLISASGRIANLTMTKDKLLDILAQKDKSIDSLSHKKQETKDTSTHTVTVITKKASFLNFWWLIIIGLLGGIFLEARFHIYSFIKKQFV